jgi:hypothetical protein
MRSDGPRNAIPGALAEKNFCCAEVARPRNQRQFPATVTCQTAEYVVYSFHPLWCYLAFDPSLTRTRGATPRRHSGTANQVRVRIEFSAAFGRI